jgi:hypothetical protein
MWVRGMTRAGHSGCQGGLSPVQTQRGNDSCAQIAAARQARPDNVRQPAIAPARSTGRRGVLGIEQHPIEARADQRLRNIGAGKARTSDE